MPGVTIWLPTAAPAAAEARFRRALRLQCRADEDHEVVDLARPTLLAGHAGRPGYPARTWRDEDVFVLLEGHVYGEDDASVRRRFTAAARRALRDPSPVPAIAGLVRETDGEFVAVLAGNDDRCLVFTDALGRLPLYVFERPDGVVISREAKSIAAIAGDWALDALGVAHTLWLGYPLGERTLFRGIRRAPAGFLFDSRLQGDRLVSSISSTFDYTCDPRSENPGLADVAVELADMFVGATRDRAAVAGDAAVVVSLSGGNDSRSVLAGVARAAPNAVAATFRRQSGGASAADAAVAGRLAAVFGVPWHLLELPPPSPVVEDRLIWIKDGLNHVGMAFILPYLEGIAARWGDRSVLLTGDGGDKVLPDLRPSRRLRSLDDVVLGILDEAEQAPAAVVEQAVGLPLGSLVADLRSRLEAYPESSLGGRAIRFQIAERGAKWLYEGEDRGRSFAWQTSPFYARPLFEAGIAIPPHLKQDLRLYAAFQRQLDERLLSIGHADLGLTIDSRRYRARALARRLALRDLGSVVRPLVQRRRRGGLGPAGPRADAVRLLRDDRASPRLSGVIDYESALRAVDGASPAALEAWRTILLVNRVWQARLD
jgi:asparagine synthase (glutamine-hydrolysing)